MGNGAAQHSGIGRLSFALCAAVGAACLAQAPARASPWARPGGELLVITRAEYFRTDLSSEDPNGGAFESLDTNTYFEFGLTPDITIGGKAIYGTAWLTDSTGSYSDSGFSELEGYTQYQFLRNNKHAASVRLSAGKPSAFQASARDTLDSGADVEVAALYGRNLTFGPVQTFTALELGYRKRFGAAADLLRGQATLGAKAGDHWMVLLESFATVSMRNEEPGGADYDIIKIQPSVVYRFNRRWSLQAGMNEEIAGRNLARGRTFFLGLWSSF